jgi:hypothetical protein
MEILLLGLVVVLSAATWLLVKLVDALEKKQ